MAAFFLTSSPAKRQWSDSHVVSFNLFFFFFKYVLLCVCVWDGDALRHVCASENMCVCVWGGDAL